MFGVGPATRIYLAAGTTDMRKGFEGLYGMVRDQLQLEPLSGHQRAARYRTGQVFRISDQAREAGLSTL
jgi:IS66 Orf2 like protein